MCSCCVCSFICSCGIANPYSCNSIAYLITGRSTVLLNIICLTINKIIKSCYSIFTKGTCFYFCNYICKILILIEPEYCSIKNKAHHIILSYYDSTLFLCIDHSKFITIYCYSPGKSLVCYCISMSI